MVCALLAGGAASLIGAVSAGSEAGLAVRVDESGVYAVTSTSPAWTFQGNVGAPLANIQWDSGSDGVGPYVETTFDWASDAPRHGAIRSYTSQPIVLFTVTCPGGCANTAPFPVFSSYPRNLRHVTYSGPYAMPSFYGFAKDSPWLFFDSAANAFIVSAASDFQVTETTWGPNNEIVTGISPKIATLPQGLSHQTILAVASGINAAFETWGNALTGLAGKTRPPNDADASLRGLGYWTDRGATYYYHTEPSETYDQTLLAVRDDFHAQGLPLAYVQLDSWFYPKGPNADWRDISDGIYSYDAAATLFTPSLRSFQQKLGIPLITHLRWIDANSPYRQKYQVSGNVAVDPKYWDDVARFLANAGVTTYEQDWLGDQAHTDFNLTDPDAFLDHMAASLAQRGITIQYCMAAPRHFLQASKYSNLTTIRTSEDRFDRNRWPAFLYAARLASAVGAYPFADAFMSGELDNLLVATLSAGPVGVGDRVGTLNATNLLLAVRQDGVIVKPDVPLAPMDASYLNETASGDSTIVASTYTDFGGSRAEYVFAFSRGADTVASFSPNALGFAGEVYIYNYFGGTGRLASPREPFSEPMASGRAYYIVAPVGHSGIAFLGDQQQLVPLGKKRIAAFQDDGTAQATVLFAAGEGTRTLFGYAPAAPTITAVKGAVGAVNYDTTSQIFSVAVTPGADQTAVVQMSAPLAAAPACDPNTGDCGVLPPGKRIIDSN